MAAVDYFLKIDGIDGESSDAKHKGEIDVESWSWGETQTRAGGIGGGGGGKAVAQDFHFVSQTNKSSPKLMLACATGEHFKKATLTVRKAGRDTQVEYLKVMIFDILVSSYQIGATQVNSDAIPRDQFSLNFSKIEMTEMPIDAAGRAGPAVFGGFDFQRNVVIPPPNPGTPGT